MTKEDCLPMARGWSTVSSATDNTAVEVSFVDDAPDANVDVNKTTFTCSDESDDDSNASATKASKEGKSHHNNKSRRCFWIIAIVIALTALAVAIALGVQVLQSKRTKMQEAPAPAFNIDPHVSTTAPDDGSDDFDAEDANANVNDSDDDGLPPNTIGQPMSSDSPAPTFSPTTDEPTSPPTRTQTLTPTAARTARPTTVTSPTATPTPLVVEEMNNLCTNGGYCPGHLTQVQHGLRLSAGLDARIIARTNKTVLLADGTQSAESFHVRPDHAATFTFGDDHPTNPGGWVYASNAEADFASHGGVGSIFFDRYGNVIDYKMVLKGTTRNCGGGRTPWGTWISCEENKSRDGQIHEVDPFGNTLARQTVLGGETGGQFESFAYDVREASQPRFFYTEDHKRGAVRRFTPSNPDWDNPLDMLHGDGTIEYLVFTEPNAGRRGKFSWTANETLGMESASLWFPNTEGIDQVDGQLFIVSKKKRRLFQLDLDTGRFISENVGRSGAFQGGPDQITRLIGKDQEMILYFTEDGGTNHPGVHGRDADGNLFMILESQDYGYAPDGSGEEDESTGLAFSPDHMHMYVCYQKNGVVFDITRRDGKTFGGRSIDVKYHKLVE